MKAKIYLQTTLVGLFNGWIGAKIIQEAPDNSISTSLFGG